MNKEQKTKMLTDHYVEHRDFYIGMIARRNNNDYAFGEDAVQEGSLIAFKYLDSFDPKRGSFGGWFRAKIFNAAFSMRLSGYTDSIDIDELHHLEEEIAWVERPENRNVVMDMIDELKNKKSQEICRLYFKFGYSVPEVSESLGCSERWVYRCLEDFKKVAEDVLIPF